MNFAREDRQVPVFSKEAEAVLTGYVWSGNVRELQNIIGRAFFLCSNNIIERTDIPIPASSTEINKSNFVLNFSYKDAKEKIIEKFELEYLTHHLKENKGNISKTAEECGLDRRSIHRIINKYNIIYIDEK